MANIAFAPSGQRPEVPDIGTDPNDRKHAGDCRTFLNHCFLYTTSKRLELERQWNRARLFDKPLQWLMPARGTSGSTWFTWEPQRLQRGRPIVPRPIRNIFSPAIQNEVSRLVKVGSKPYVRVDDPEATDAAELGKAALLDRNERTGWFTEDRLGAYHAAMFGQRIQTISRQLNYIGTAMEAFPVLGSVACEGCGYRLSEPGVPEDLMPKLADAAFPNAIARQRVEGRPLEYQNVAKGCPACGHEMAESPVPRPPSGDYRDAGQDPLGRDLFQELPPGEEVSEVTSPYCFFPFNQGVGYCRDEDMREWGIRTPRDLDYLAQRYKDGERVKREAEVDLFQHHPIVMGNWGLTYRPEGVWKHHALEDIWVQKPTRRFPRGRLIIMAGDLLLQDSELFITDTDIPWIDTYVAPWELIENEIWGKSLASDLFSIQVNINSAISQRMDIRQKWVSPKLILHQGQDIQFSGGSDSMWSSDVWRVDSRGLPPDVQARYPIPFGNTGSGQGISEELQQELDFVPTISGAFDPETGNVSGAELNYSALLFAATKSAERRKPREDALRMLKRKTWTMRLRHIAHFTPEPVLIHVRDDHDEWTVRKFRGQSLKDQTDVALEDEPLVDSGIALRASIEQASKMGTLLTAANGGTPANDRVINRALNLPEDLNKDMVVQEKLARREWLAWVEDGIEAAVDEHADHHAIHWTQHALDLLNSRQARIAMKVLLVQHQTPWSKVLLAVTRWKQLLYELSAMADLVERGPALLERSDKLIAQMTVAAEQDPMNPEAGMPAGESMPDPNKEMAAQRIFEAREQRNQIAQRIDQAAQATAGFPEALELRIYVVWERLLKQHGVGIVSRPGAVPVGWIGTPPLVKALAPPLITLLRGWAHAYSHYLIWKGMTAPQLAPGGPGPGAGAAAPEPQAPPPGAGPPEPGMEAAA